MSIDFIVSDANLNFARPHLLAPLFKLIKLDGGGGPPQGLSEAPGLASLGSLDREQSDLLCVPELKSEKALAFIFSSCRPRRAAGESALDEAWRGLPQSPADNDLNAALKGSTGGDLVESSPKIKIVFEAQMSQKLHGELGS